MRTSKSILAAVAVVTFVGSGAFAAEQIQGKIVKLDKGSHQITLQLGASGQTVGSANAATQIFTLNHDPSYDSLQVGDQVKLNVEEQNGVRQVVKWEK